ncbi:MAG: Uncharacterized protein G01um101418_438 [Parcubacteria group bacterium Gr01-1014_18]|nr:MAG: Uncharacterized protein Greene041636_483 [Parcubacteria group bacterium Greene0416_36]TSC81025.1 MAG: Uncharacterized protein G01um101418_438 [Parcubacteria group bacterium Gr01-1014_18]TSC98947.1 MAG: Uncharacterized protein Greene101420_459 [Parcubacteria group bacterium Greene1014_20]TSD06761.1 MAG: Uncharacterized protein Greene07142_682 [Parcubacteria group bacterium Greene0714_2]
MVKDLVCTLVSIKYSGKSIGSDIRIEIEGFGIFFGLNKKIKNGTTSQIHKEIGRLRVDQSNLVFSVTLKIIERDLVFNDVGVEQFLIKFDLESSTPQQVTRMVKVHEFRGLTEGSEARFEVVLYLEVVDSIRYIGKQDNGFLRVKMEDGTEESVPEYLKILFRYTEAKRDYFLILEGLLQGQRASVRLKEDGSSHFILNNLHTGPAELIYSISEQKLKVKGQIYKVVPYLGQSWDKGFYDVEIPDHPHKLGRTYLDRATKALVWFHIGHDYKDARYLHPGRVTAGCITIPEVERWDELFNTLIVARKGDSKSIGVLEVVA